MIPSPKANKPQQSNANPKQKGSPNGLQRALVSFHCGRPRENLIIVRHVFVRRSDPGVGQPHYSLREWTGVVLDD